MPNNRATVEDVIQLYFGGLYEGDAGKLGEAFHPSADLRWVEKCELQGLWVPDWLDRVRRRPSAKVAEGKPREDFVATMDRSDEKTASGKANANCRRAISPTICAEAQRRLEDRLEELPVRFEGMKLSGRSRIIMSG